MAGEILTQLNRIDSNIDAAFEKCRALGATMPSTINSDYLADTIETIPSSADIPVKTAADMTVSGATVTAPAGWYKQAASKAVPTTTQATPSIEVNSSGLITAKTTQSAGYVAAGTKSATKQLTKQAGKTVTPTKSEQTVAEAGVYTTGAIKVASIPDKYVDTTEADATDDDIVAPKIAYVKGEKVVGTNPYEKTATDSEVDTQAAKIAQLSTILDGKAAGGGASIETCTVTITHAVFAPYMYEIIYMDGTKYSVTATAFKGDLSVVKNSIIVVAYGSSSWRLSGNVEQIGSFVGVTVYFVSGDATITATE